VTIPNLGSAAISGTFTRDATYGTLYELKGSIGLSAPGYNFGTASFRAYRALTYGYPVTGMQAEVAVNIPDLVAGTVQASIHSSGNFAFDADLRTQGKLGSALGGAFARVSFRHGSTQSFSFSASVKNVMKIPGSFTLSGDISSNGGYDVSASVYVGPWSGSTDLGVCDAYYSVDATLSARVKGGGGSPFSIAVSGKAGASAGCGSLGVSIGVSFDFKYTEPSTFSLSVRVNLDFGLYDWNPTVFSA
jgi:hypothetical protein